MFIFIFIIIIKQGIGTIVLNFPDSCTVASTTQVMNPKTVLVVNAVDGSEMFKVPGGQPISEASINSSSFLVVVRISMKQHAVCQDGPFLLRFLLIDTLRFTDCLIPKAFPISWNSSFLRGFWENCNSSHRFAWKKSEGTLPVYYLLIEIFGQTDSFIQIGWLIDL